MASPSVWPSPPSSNKTMVSSSVWPSLPGAEKNMVYSSVWPSFPNWVDLPSELTSLILLRLGPVEILESAQKVCRSWRHICNDPYMWRKIDLGDVRSRKYDLKSMCRHLVDRSQGGLTEIAILYFCTDSLLNYIADRSYNLTSLRLVGCHQITDKGFVKAIVKLPLLEDLELSYCMLSHISVKVAGQSCPNMKTLKISCYDEWSWIEDDKQALAIAETMPKLRHIQLTDHNLSDTGLNAILDKCPNLEYLDLRRCFDITFAGDLEKRCFERIKVVRRPRDPLNGYPFDTYGSKRDFEVDEIYSGCWDSDSDTCTYINPLLDDDFPDDTDYEYDQYDKLYDFIVD